MAAASQQLVEEIEKMAKALRVCETERALRRMGLNGGPESDEVVALAERVCARILAPPLRSVRLAEKRGDEEALHAAEQLFSRNGKAWNRDRR